ncbi:MAG: hypothetical protein C4330_01105 [Chitinophagaceae bacterium]
MTGLFVGLTVTMLCLLFNYIYRESTGFAMSAIINITTIIFFVNVVFLVVGLLYYGIQSVAKGELIFIILMVLVTLFCIWRATYAHRSDNTILNTEFKTLLIGDISIMGLAAAFLLPFLYHNRMFEEKVI